MTIASRSLSGIRFFRWNRGDTAGNPPPENHSFFRDLCSVVGSRIVVQLATFISGVIIARSLGVEGRGLLAALTVAPTVIISLSDMGIPAATAFHIGRKNYTVQEVAPTLAIMAIIASLAGTTACIVYFWFFWLPQYTWLLVAASLAMIPFSLATNYAAGVFLGTQRITQYNSMTWTSAIFRLLFVSGLAVTKSLGLFGALFSQIAASGLNFGRALVLLRRITPIRGSFNREMAGKFSRLGFTYAVSVFVITLNYRLNILLLQQMSTLDQVGIYALGTVFAELIWQIPTALSNIVFSRSANAAKPEEFTAKVLVLARLALACGTFVAISFAIAGPYFISFVYGRQFEPSAKVLTTMLPGIVAFIVFKIFSFDMAGKGKPWVLMIVVVPSFLLNLAMGFILIPEYGAIGAAWAACISYCAAAVGFIFLYSHILRIPILDIVLYRKSDLRMVTAKLPFLRRFSGKAP